MTETAKPSGIARIVFKEILAGDRRKFEAQSNDTPSGGGARDLRFSPYDRFVHVFEKMFPHVDGNGVRAGKFHWVLGTHTIIKDAFFHSPTTARPTEGRLANIDKVLPGDRLPDAAEGRVYLLIVQRTDGTLWPHFVTERSLRTDDWHEAVRDNILRCQRAPRRSGVAASGYMDFETGGLFCNDR